MTAERAGAMAASVRAALRSASEEDVGLVARAHALAMEPRLAALDDDHHPAYLHPGRSVLILLRDVGDVPATGLAAAALLESEDAALRVSEERVATELGEPITEWVRRPPQPGDIDLVERLVALPREAVLAVLAERLDHLRHLHLRPDLEPTWHDRHEEVVRAWQPVAGRVDDLLARRFGHWVRTFGRRLGSG